MQEAAHLEGPHEDGRRAAIRDELARIEESATWSAQGQFEQAKQWRAINLIFGVPASVLAAVSGATALASTAGRFVAGLLALASAAFGAIVTTVNASRRAAQASAAGNAYLEIQTAARQARLVDLDHLTIEEARELLAELTNRRDEQNQSAEPPNRWAYKRARKNILRGGQSYAVDQQEPWGEHNG